MQNVINASSTHRVRGRYRGRNLDRRSIPIPIPTPTPKRHSGFSLCGLGILALILPLLVLGGWSCSSKPYRLKDIAKSDIDMVADVHLKEIDRLMHELVVKLYHRNPRELAKAADQTIESRSATIFDRSARPLAELYGRRGPEAILLCFDPSYAGDRVLALVAGLADMVYRAYNDKSEFYMLDSLDQQLLYNSARNIEVAVWKLSNARLADGGKVLISNSLEGEVQNLSFEREFGKLIASQDLLALILEDRGSRSINRVVQGLVFLPI